MLRVRCPVCDEEVALKADTEDGVVAVEHCCPPHIFLVYLAKGKVIGTKSLSAPIIIRDSFLEVFRFLGPKLSSTLLAAAIEKRLKDVRGDDAFVSQVKFALLSLGLSLGKGDVVIDLWKRSATGSVNRRLAKSIEKVLAKVKDPQNLKPLLKSR